MIVAGGNGRGFGSLGKFLETLAIRGGRNKILSLFRKFTLQTLNEPLRQHRRAVLGIDAETSAFPQKNSRQERRCNIG